MNSTLQSGGRKIERLFLLLLTVVFAILFLSLYNVLDDDFGEVRGRLAEGSMVNLNAGKTDERIEKLLIRGYYFNDKKDIRLIRSVIQKNYKTREVGEIDNIGELNKKRYFVNAEDAYVNGGEVFKRRVSASRALLGFTGDDSLRFDQERTKPPQLSPSVDLSLGEYDISGQILKRKEKSPVAGVLVRLEMIMPRDSVYSDQVSEVERRAIETGSGFKKQYLLDKAGHKQLESITAYVRTDDQGSFSFHNLPGDKAYEVLPMQPGFQFGSSQGIQELGKNVSFKFYQDAHTIRLLSSRDFNILKKEKTLIVRTPEEFTEWYLIIAGGFFACFIFVHILLSLRFPQTDQLIVPVLMLLTGLSFLTLLSLQDPIRDRFLAKDSLTYLAIGIAGLCCILFINVRKFTVDSRLYRMYVFSSISKAANGWPWAVVAIGLLALTIAFGTGPEGSGVKVNLFGVQPSEIVKYTIIIFLAGFFSMNEKFISEYRTYRKRWAFFSFALIAILLSILLFRILPH